MSHPSDPPGHDLLTAALVGSAYVVVVFATGFLLGTLACRRLTGAFEVPPASALRLVMGGAAFLILMGAELGLSVILFGRTVTEHLAQYREIHTMLGLAGQVAFGMFPLMRLW